MNEFAGRPVGGAGSPRLNPQNPKTCPPQEDFRRRFIKF